MKPALVIGHRGQDGRLLMERFAREGREAVGVGRQECDILSRAAVADLVKRVQPGEIYYLPAYHHSSEEKVQIDDSELLRRSYEVHVGGLSHFLEAMKAHSPRSRLFYAATSHVFGNSGIPLQDEKTPFNPPNIYGLTKVAGIHTCRFYRTVHGVFAAAGILYNHESRYRRETFVSQKIIRAALRVQEGASDPIVLGDLSARVDWGYAPDYVDAMVRMLALPEPDDFVVATGEARSVMEFVECAFGQLGLEWRPYVRENSTLITKGISMLCGNADKLRKLTGWEPTVTFAEMVSLLLGKSPDRVVSRASIAG